MSKTKTLHIYLNSEDSEFNFEAADFLAFRTAHPTFDLQFLESEQELIDSLPVVTWLDTWYFDPDWFDLAPQLRRIFTPAAGREYVAMDKTGRVTNHYGTFHGTMMAESALTLMLQFSLNLPRYQSQQRSRIWQRIPARLLRNQTVLIIGYGHIGKQTATLLTTMGMTVWGHQRQPRSVKDGPVTLVAQSELDSYLPRADHIISFLPGGDETHHFISEARISMMSTRAYLYNFGRGTTIDETALLRALDNDNLAGAGLDVTEVEPLPTTSDLWNHPKVVLLPHASSYFEEYRALHVTEITKLVTNV